MMKMNEKTLWNADAINLHARRCCTIARLDSMFIPLLSPAGRLQSAREIHLKAYNFKTLEKGGKDEDNGRS